jgi:hypothetical protein
MLAYLARRWPERSTRFGLIALPLTIVIMTMAWHWRQQIGQIAAAIVVALNTASIVLPDRILKILATWRALREALPRSIPAAAPVSTGTPAPQKESTLMSLIDFAKLKADVAQAEAAAEEATKAVIAAARSEAGQKVVADGIAAMPSEFQPVAKAIEGVFVDPSTANKIAVLETIYALFEQAKSSAAEAAITPQLVLAPSA